MEAISLDEIDDEAFDSLEKEVAQEGLDDELDGRKDLEGNVYDFEELGCVDCGLVPTAFEEEVSIIGLGGIGELMSSGGVLSQRILLPLLLVTVNPAKKPKNVSLSFATLGNRRFATFAGRTTRK